MSPNDVKDGNYAGCITSAWVEQGQKPDELVLAFAVDLCDADGKLIALDESAVCRHPAFGEYAHLAQAVVRHLGLEWPFGIEHLSESVGRPVTVKAKRKEYRGQSDVRFYINVSARKPATPAGIAAGIAKLAAAAGAADDPDNIPF